MEVGERYIIEISDVIATNNGNIAKIKGFNALVFDERGFKKLSKVEVDPRFLTQRGISESLSQERQYGYNNGYNNGYDKGFKDGVKHQESMMPPKAEPHEPKEGDVYLDSLGQALMIFNVKRTKCMEMYDDGSGGEIKIEDLETRKYVGNIKADLEALQRVVGSYE